jgi:cell division protease FtsH
MARSMARIRMREDRLDQPSTPDDVERALTEYDEKTNYTPREERLLATHEAGHAVTSLFSEHGRPIERITIKSEMPWAPAYVMHRQDDSRRLGLTYKQMVTDLVVLYGGIEAERLLLDDISTGAAGSDLVRATQLAHYIVEFCGMGGETLSLRQFLDPEKGVRRVGLSEEQRKILDAQVNELIRHSQAEASRILKEHQLVLESLRDLLLDKKTIDAKTLREAFPDMPLKPDEETDKPEEPAASAEKPSSEKKTRKKAEKATVEPTNGEVHDG